MAVADKIICCAKPMEMIVRGEKAHVICCTCSHQFIIPIRKHGVVRTAK
ncbi:hypothetical protein [Alteribacillus sp. HJP-4]